MLASDLKRVPSLALGRVKFRVNLLKCTIAVAFSSPPHLGLANILKSCGTYRTALMVQRLYRELENDGTMSPQSVVWLNFKFALGGVEGQRMIPLWCI